MYCENCKVYVETPTLECPLCKANLKESYVSCDKA